MLTECVNCDDLRCYLVPGQLWNGSCVNSSWGQMLSNAIYLDFQWKTFQQTCKVLPAAEPDARPCTSWTIACWRLQLERKETPRDQWGGIQQGGQWVPSPSPAESPAPACFMSLLLLTWVFPRAQAPFELCLLDSSQLLLLWPSETQLPPCPGSETEYVSIQSWVIITNS